MLIVVAVLIVVVVLQVAWWLNLTIAIVYSAGSVVTVDLCLDYCPVVVVVVVVIVDLSLDYHPVVVVVIVDSFAILEWGEGPEEHYSYPAFADQDMPTAAVVVVAVVVVAVVMVGLDVSAGCAEAAAVAAA